MGHLPERNSHQRGIGQHKVMSQRTQYRHQVKDPFRSLLMGQDTNFDLVFRTKHFTKLSYPLLIRTVSQSNGTPGLIQPNQISSLNLPGGFDASQNGKTTGLKML